MRALSLCGRLRVMIAILPWVDSVICSSKVDMLAFLSAAGGKGILPYVYRMDIDLTINQKQICNNTSSEEELIDFVVIE